MIEGTGGGVNSRASLHSGRTVRRDASSVRRAHRSRSDAGGPACRGLGGQAPTVTPEHTRRLFSPTV
jgi:hypothetical protein